MPVANERSRELLPASISRQSDFSRIYKQGRRYRTSLFTAVVVRHDDPCRAAFVVSRKVAKQAVRRNRIRRWLREALRRLLAGAECRADIVLIAHQPAYKAGYWAIYRELANMLGRAGLITRGDPSKQQEG
ncbi:MAG: ribonuclease P protein component [Armatimonadia bacterium]